MARARVRSSGMSSIAVVLMVVLGVFTLLEVNFTIGAAIVLLGAGMYAFNWWMRARFARPIA
ncbi:MAG: hypothetical protein OK456_01670 [Thaumarchaeota archaeon]|nr:hypothetical protein [Nitrososphaerota archaeon]